MTTIANLENRTVVTNATTFEQFKKAQKHNYYNMPANVRNAFMLRDWKKINNNEA